MRTGISFKGNCAYWKSFKWGEIIPERSVFRVVPRTRKNIFKMFDGLGINLELLSILQDLGIRYIEIPFNNKILKTTTDKYLRYGIPSRYESEKVDKQMILRLDRINLDDISIRKNSDIQGSLFASA